MWDDPLLSRGDEFGLDEVLSDDVVEVHSRCCFD